ncbi:hypothetical protein TNCV_3907641 [Trichonephila clavipes]|nr:hypothetical protein TNCV_3907641 [Trichonephila clavipes]
MGRRSADIRVYYLDVLTIEYCVELSSGQILASLLTFLTGTVGLPTRVDPRWEGFGSFDTLARAGIQMTLRRAQLVLFVNIALGLMLQNRMTGYPLVSLCQQLYSGCALVALARVDRLSVMRRTMPGADFALMNPGIGGE